MSHRPRFFRLLSLLFPLLVACASDAPVGPVPVPVPSPVARVTIAEGDLALIVGSERRLTATAFDGRGAPLARRVVWSSANPAVVMVDSAGQVVATGPGTTTLTAVSEGRSAMVAVAVSGQLWRMTDAGGAGLPGTLYTTTVTRDGVARAARFQVTGGVVGLSGQRYTMRLRGTLLIDGAPSEHATFTAEGALAYDVWESYAPVFFEGNEWVNRVPRFRSRYRADGSLEIAYIAQPGASVVPLGFAQ